MFKSSRFSITDVSVIIAIITLSLISTLVLKSIQGSLYPTYFVFILLAFLTFFTFLKIDFEVLLAFSSHLYFISIILLVLPLIIGQVTRGAIRWIPVGSLTFQPSEIIRPFLLVFFAKYLTEKELNLGRLLRVTFFLLLPFSLILIQPSLGVAIITGFGFFGVLLASSINKKYIFLSLLLFSLLLPSFWFFLKPYQKERISSFVNPARDPLGRGYNSIQSTIAVGSGGLLGRGLGKGVQTQLNFLPERHSDFIFASLAEELGFVGCFIVLFGLFIICWSLLVIVQRAKSPAARAFVIGAFFILFIETFVHLGMNMGLLPITGIPLPFVSAGGSALLGSMISIAIAINAKS